MLNACMVKGDSGCLKLPEFREKLPGKNVFLTFKTTVNYKSRFWLAKNRSGRAIIRYIYISVTYASTPLPGHFPSEINRPRRAPSKRSK